MLADVLTCPLHVLHVYVRLGTFDSACSFCSFWTVTQDGLVKSGGWGVSMGDLQQLHEDAHRAARAASPAPPGGEHPCACLEAAQPPALAYKSGQCCRPRRHHSLWRRTGRAGSGSAKAAPLTSTSAPASALAAPSASKPASKPASAAGSPASQCRSRCRGPGGSPGRTRGTSAAETQRWTSKPRGQPQQATRGRSRHREGGGRHGAHGRGTAIRRADDAPVHASVGTELTKCQRHGPKSDVATMQTSPQADP